MQGTLVTVNLSKCDLYYSALTIFRFHSNIELDRRSSSEEKKTLSTRHWWQVKDERDAACVAPRRVKSLLRVRLTVGLVCCGCCGGGGGDWRGPRRSLPESFASSKQLYSSGLQYSLLDDRHQHHQGRSVGFSGIRYGGSRWVVESIDSGGLQRDPIPIYSFSACLCLFQQELNILINYDNKLFYDMHAVSDLEKATWNGINRWFSPVNQNTQSWSFLSQKTQNKNADPNLVTCRECKQTAVVTWFMGCVFVT